MILAGIISLFFINILDIFQIVFNITSNNPQLISIIIGILTAFIVSRYSYQKNRQMEHESSFQLLINELKDNRKRMDSFQSDFEEAKHTWLTSQEPTPVWIKNKKASFGYSTKVYQYFPCSAFNNFLNRGYHLNIVNNERLGSLMKLYSITIDFSNKVQSIEEKILKLKYYNYHRLNRAQNIHTDPLAFATSSYIDDYSIMINDGMEISDYCDLIQKMFNVTKNQFIQLYNEFDVLKTEEFQIEYKWQIFKKLQRAYVQINEIN